MWQLVGEILVALVLAWNAVSLFFDALYVFRSEKNT